MLNNIGFSPATLAEWQARATILLNLIGMVWAIDVLNWTILGHALHQFGIRPRTLPGLMGIAFSPLIHADGMHLIGNSLAFFVFGWLLLLRGSADFLIVSLLSALTAGTGIWLFGKPHSNHIGASGIVFGYFGFLLLANFFERNLLSLILSLTVGTFYWHLLPDLLPRFKDVSWEAHLFGFLGGGLAAYFLPLLRVVLLPYLI
jgi:membrane associated rhomboid family serine protease